MTASAPGVKSCEILCKRTGPRVRASVRAIVRAHAGMAFRYWAWPVTFHIGPMRGAAPCEARPRSRICCSGLCGHCSSRHRAHRVLVVVLELGHVGHRSKRIDADEQLHRLGDVDRNVPSKAHHASAGSAGRHVEAVVNVDVLDGLVAEMLFLPSVMLNMVIARAGA